MKARSSFPQRHGGRLLPLRFAARELRGGLRGFYVFIACTALGVMAIAGVSSLAAGLAEGLAREGRVILGGDLAFTLSMRSANAEERAFLDRQGAVSLAARAFGGWRTAPREGRSCRSPARASVRNERGSPVP